MTCLARAQSISKPVLHDHPEGLPAASEARPSDQAKCRRRPADVEMARVLKTAPVRMASDPSSGAIAHWKHEPCTTSSSP